MNRTKKAKIAQKEPHKNISKDLAIQHPCTKIPDSEIKLENIVQGIPSFVPHSVKSSKGKGKGVKNIKLNDSGFALEMARWKTILTAKQRVAQAGKQQEPQKLPCPNLVKHRREGRPLGNSWSLKLPVSREVDKGLRPSHAGTMPSSPSERFDIFKEVWIY